MKTNLIIAASSLPIAALAAFGAWHLADSPSQGITRLPVAKAEQRSGLQEVQTIKADDETRSGNAEAIGSSLPEISEADQWSSAALDSSRPRTERVAAAAAFLTTASKAQAEAFLKAISDMETRLPGEAVWLLDLTRVHLSEGASEGLVEALFPPQDRASQLGEAMQEAVFKGLRTDQNVETVGHALTERWAAEPTSLVHSQIESVDNPWFYSGSAVVAGQKGDAQMVQEALARLETCLNPATPRALLAMAQSGLATTDDLADTLHYWAQRQPDASATLASLTSLLVDSRDPAQRSLLAIAIAGANGQGGARPVLEKALSQANASDRAGIEYALRLADEATNAGGPVAP